MISELLAAPQLERILGLAIANWVLWWGVFRFVPDALNNYGFDFFNWKRYRRQNPLLGIGLIAIGNGFLASINTSTTHAAWAPAGLALALVSMWGIFRLDRAFLIIPNRFHITGTLGAGVFFGENVATTPESWSLPVVAAGLGLVLPLLLLGLNTIYVKARKVRGLGFGDIKLLIWLPLLIGDRIWIAFAISCMLAALAQGLRWVVTQKVDLTRPFAFGPYLVLSAIACL
jgi:prepilin signal peptidase PulO-like enzyme (type II secretory pathway)